MQCAAAQATLVDRLTLQIGATLRITLLISLILLPFELTTGIALGVLTLTNVELLIGLSIALWGARLLAEGRWPAVPRWLLIGGGIFICSLLVSALLAGDQRIGGLKFALRQIQGFVLAFVVADTVWRDGEQAARLLGSALLGGAGMSAALGLLELSDTALMQRVLAVFKTENTYMGGLLRLSGTFSYANTAAMYFEALLPLALLTAITRRTRLGTLLCAVLAALLLFAALLTYSRAAFVVCALVLLATPILAWACLGHARRATLLSGGLITLVLALIVLNPTVRLRLSEPDVARWYGAIYRPTGVAPMAPNEVRRVPIELENDGRVVWEAEGSRPVRLAYHWIDAASGAMVRFEGRRTALPQRVQPGETIALEAIVQAPLEAGEYILVWDVVREYIGRGWFSQMGVPPAEVPVAVRGEAVRTAPQPGIEPPTTPRTIAMQPGPPPRRELWGVALAFWRERPLLGIGPDAFRHVYGPALGMAVFDDRVHTNNLYLELLTGAGLFGLGAFLFLSGAGLRTGWQSLRELEPGTWAAILPVAALIGLGAFLVHGLLDVFLAFTPTYALLWVMFGLIQRPDRTGQGVIYAHRL